MAHEAAADFVASCDALACTVFITGATGLMGRHLIPLLLRRGHRVRAPVRGGSESKAPQGCEIICGDARGARSAGTR